MTPLALALLLAAGPAADTWPGFRGDGTSRTAARDLPLEWSPAAGVAWRVETPLVRPVGPGGVEGPGVPDGRVR